MSNDFIRLVSGKSRFCREIELWTRTPDGRFRLYKAAGLDWRPPRGGESQQPQLFIKREDSAKVSERSELFFYDQLHSCLNGGEPEKVKGALINFMEAILDEPRVGNLMLTAIVIEAMVAHCYEDPSIIANLTRISNSDVSTAVHSVGVMSFALGFCLFTGHSEEETRQLGLASLLHDVGKTRVPQEVLNAPRQLSANEMQKIREHVNLGQEILASGGPITRNITPITLEHHEKLDGSGYPNGTSKISHSGQVMTMIDIYEALTNKRPYRAALQPFEALWTIKKEVQMGQLNREIFKSLELSLAPNIP